MKEMKIGHNTVLKRNGTLNFELDISNSIPNKVDTSYGTTYECPPCGIKLCLQHTLIVHRIPRCARDMRYSVKSDPPEILFDKYLIFPHKILIKICLLFEHLSSLQGS